MLRKKAKVVEVRQRAKEKYLQSQKIKGQNFIQSAKNHFFILLNEVSRNTTPFFVVASHFCRVLLPIIASSRKKANEKRLIWICNSASFSRRCWQLSSEMGASERKSVNWIQRPISNYSERNSILWLLFFGKFLSSNIRQFFGWIVC